MCQLCLFCCPTSLHMGQRSEVNFFHLQRLTLWGESPQRQHGKDKACSVGVVTESLHSSSPFSLIVKRWLSLARELAWSRCALLLFPSIILRVSIASFFLGAFGCSFIVVIISSVGFSFLSVPVSWACLHFARMRQVESACCLQQGALGDLGLLGIACN